MAIYSATKKYLKVVAPLASVCVVAGFSPNVYADVKMPEEQETLKLPTENTQEFKAISLIQNNQEDKTTDEEATQELTMTVGDADKMIREKDYESPIIKEAQTTWEGTAWQGQTLHSKIDVITEPDKGLKKVTLTPGKFTNGEYTLPSDALTIQWLRNVHANIGRGQPNAPVEAFPDVVYKGGSLDIPEQTIQSAWLTFDIPKEAPAGMYTGTISLTAEDSEPVDFQYHLNVLGLEQPTTESVGTEVQIWQHPIAIAEYYDVPESEWFTEAHFKHMRDAMEDYAKLGGHDAVVNIVEEAWNHQSYTGDPSMVKWTRQEDGSFSFDYTWLDSWVNFLIETKVLNPAKGIGQIKSYSIVPWNNVVTYYDQASGRKIRRNLEPGSSEWKEIWTTFLENYLEHMSEKGWLDMTYISMDERSLEQLKPAVELIKTVKTKEGQTFKISSALNYQSPDDYSFTDQIDDMSVDLNNIDPSNTTMQELAEHRQSLGLKTTMYTATGDYPNNNLLNDPASNTWTMWYTLKLGLNGFMRWAFDDWVRDPLNNPNYKYWEPGDGWFIYPLEKGEERVGFYSTPRYDLFKEGIQEVNQARYLMANGTEEVKQKVKALVDSLKRPKLIRDAYGSAVAANESERELMLSEVKRMRQGLNAIAEAYALSLQPIENSEENPVNPKPSQTEDLDQIEQDILSEIDHLEHKETEKENKSTQDSVFDFSQVKFGSWTLPSKEKTEEKVEQPAGFEEKEDQQESSHVSISSSKEENKDQALPSEIGMLSSLPSDNHSSEVKKGKVEISTKTLPQTGSTANTLMLLGSAIALSLGVTLLKVKPSYRE